MESSPINLDGVRFHVRESIKALEADVDGERIRDCERHIRAASALLDPQKNVA